MNKNKKKINEDYNLLSVYPIVKDMWCYDDNVGLDPTKLAPHSNKFANFKCKNGHKFRVKINRLANSLHSENKGCGYCYGRKIDDTNSLMLNCPGACDNWDYDKNEDTPSDVSRNSNKKRWFTCTNNHSILMVINQKVLNYDNTGNKCNSCNKESKSLKNMLPILAGMWDYDKNEDTPADISYRSHKLRWFICSNNHSHYSSLHKMSINHTSSSEGCRYCSGKKPSKENNLGNIDKIASQWNYDKNEDTPRDVTRMSRKKRWFTCECGYEHYTAISSKARSVNSPSNGCFVCSYDHKGLPSRDWPNVVKNQDCFLYYVKFYRKDEEFYKIGISNNVDSRARKIKQSSDYEYKIISVLNRGRRIDIFNEEQDYHEKYKEFQYIPLIKFGGYTECFTHDILNLNA